MNHPAQRGAWIVRLLPFMEQGNIYNNLSNASKKFAYPAFQLTGGITTGTGSAWIVIEGFEILGARATGVKVNGDFTTIRDCWIHNNAMIGVEAHGVRSLVFENNIVEYNGANPQFGHGIYADGHGGLYVADSEAHRIRLLR